MNKTLNAVLRILTIKDADRHPHIAGNPDWDEIGPALQEWANVMVPEMRASAANTLRVICETIYVMGYMRGLNKPKLEFVVVASEEAKAE